MTSKGLSHPVGYLFTQMIVPFAEKKLFSSMLFSLSIVDLNAFALQQGFES